MTKPILLSKNLKKLCYAIMPMNCRGKFKFAKKKFKFELNVSRVVPLHQWFESILKPLMKRE